MHTPRAGCARATRSTVTVRLTRSGNETLSAVRLALQVPQGWTVQAVGPTVFHNVTPSQSPRRAVHCDAAELRAADQRDGARDR